MGKSCVTYLLTYLSFGSALGWRHVNPSPIWPTVLTVFMETAVLLQIWKFFKYRPELYDHSVANKHLLHLCETLVYTNANKSVMMNLFETLSLYTRIIMWAAWSMDYGVWSMEHGAWNMEHETLSMEHWALSMEHWAWSMEHGAWNKQIHIVQP